MDAASRHCKEMVTNWEQIRDKMPSPEGEGVCGSDRRRMRGRLAAIAREWAAAEAAPLIRLCGATFPLRGRQEQGSCNNFPLAYNRGMRYNSFNRIV